MKLGTQTGSMTNHLLSRAVVGQPEPVEGMGATVLCYSDRHAATITHVSRAHKTTVVYVRQDKATRTDKNGMSESQSWAFEPNPQGALYTFRQSKNGQWEEVRVNEKTGRFNKIEGNGLRIGERAEYYDFTR